VSVLICRPRRASAACPKQKTLDPRYVTEEKCEIFLESYSKISFVLNPIDVLVLFMLLVAFLAFLVSCMLFNIHHVTVSALAATCYNH
jgi:hypothetical protein